MIEDYLNNNSPVYDYRNLIIELHHHTFTTVDTFFVIQYYYDESGNRIRKKIFKFIGSIFDAPPEEPGESIDVSDPEYWELIRDEVYSRDVSGREMAIYVNETIEEYPTYGLDMIGKIKDDVPYYYYKDHLGSVRAVVNSSNQLVSAQDYDQWGYILQNRTFSSSKSKFKFTEKERDVESSYDYFGARYYDSRIANWTSIDPLLEKHFDWSPYNYVLRNPLRLIDPEGKQVEVIGLAAVAEAALFTGAAIYAGYQLYQIYENYSPSHSITLPGNSQISIFQKNEFGELVLPNPIEEILVSPSYADKKKLKGLESQLKNIEQHLFDSNKLPSLKPEDPDPSGLRNVWKLQIIKAIQETYKDFKQAFRNIKGKDFMEHIENTFGKERMTKIYENLKQHGINFEDFIK